MPQNVDEVAFLRARNLGKADSSTSTAASATPTSTDPASSPSSVSSDSGGSGNETSPPLILAFLAVGLFTVAMIAIFGWRRMRTTPRSLSPRILPAARGSAPKTLGPKPLLWDLWTVPPNVHGHHWQDIMPFSVHEITSVSAAAGDAVSEKEPNPQDEYQPPHLRYLTASTWSDQSDQNNLDPEDTPQEVVVERLQIAVAIAMPSPPRAPQPPVSKHQSYASEMPLLRTDSSPDLRETHDSLYYSIGLIEIPWKETVSTGT